MKLFTKSENGVETTFDVPTSTVVSGAGILAVVQALSTFFINWLTTVPSNRAMMEIQEKNFKIQMLQRVLESDEPANRANSLKLLIITGLLDDSKDEIKKVAGTPAAIPKWPVHPLEAFNTKLDLPLSSSTSLPTSDQPRTTPVGSSSN